MSSRGMGVKRDTDRDPGTGSEMGPERMGVSGTRAGGMGWSCGNYFWLADCEARYITLHHSPVRLIMMFLL